MIARGTRKFLSKLSPHAMPFSELTIMIAHGKLIPKLAGVETKQDFRGMREDLNRLVLGLSLHEIVRETVREGVADHALYDYLIEAYRWLSTLSALSSERLRFISHGLTLKWLGLVGLGPKVDACVVCSRPTNEFRLLWLSTAAGGVICNECMAKDHSRFADAEKVSEDIVAALRWVAEAPMNAMLGVALLPHLSALGTIQSAFSAYHLADDRQVPKFLSSINYDEYKHTEPVLVS